MMRTEAGDDAGQGADTARPEIAARLQRLLERRVSKGDVRHVLVGVERTDGSLRWIGAVGHAAPEGPEITARQPFYVASVTKLYIAVVVLQMHEEGLLDIADPVTEYLPRSSVDGLHVLDGVDWIDSVTIRHLLGHTSGLADYVEDRPAGGKSLMDQILSAGDRAWTFDEMKDMVRRLEPHFPPSPTGTPRQRARYSDTNYQLLIAIIEAVAGHPLPRAFEQRLLTPLDLDHTYVAGHPRADMPTCEPATVWFKDRPLEISEAMRSARDLVSTTNNSLTFMAALVRGDLFQRAETSLLMSQRWNRIMFPLQYGLGMMRFRMPRLLSPTYPVPELLGHSGSTGSWLFLCPKLSLLLTGTLDQASSPALPFRFLPKLLRVLR